MNGAVVKRKATLARKKAAQHNSVFRLEAQDLSTASTGADIASDIFDSFTTTIDPGLLPAMDE